MNSHVNHPKAYELEVDDEYKRLHPLIFYSNPRVHKTHI